jgi:hypothetical protein
MTAVRGGDKFALALSQIAKQLSRPEVVRVGFLEGATYPDGTPVGLVAAVNEYGAPSRGVPPRPFFRNMIADKSADWPEALGKTLQATGLDQTKALELMGQGVAAQLRQSIVETDSPPLAQSTIDRKGSSKPLVDTGHMLNSVDYEVKS